MIASCTTPACVLPVLLTFGLAGCGDSTLDLPPVGGEPGQVTFQFKMHGDVSGVQDFRAATSDPDVLATVREQLQLSEDERHLFIIGPIARGDGGDNPPWHWHFVPGQWTLTEFAIELCDGNAVLVDQDVDYWVDTVGQFCPWNSYVAAEVPPGS
jgi:hypothetical protein